MTAATRHRFQAATGLGASCVILGALLAAPALAQSQPPPQSTTVAAKKPAKPSATAAASAPKAPDAAAPGEPGLRMRVEQLEEQLVDLQVTIGTLESLSKSAGTAASSASFRAGNTGGGATAGSGQDTARVEQLDIQLRALLQQVEQLSDRVRSLEASPRTAAAAPRPAAPVVTPSAAPAVAGAATSAGAGAVASAGRGVDTIGDILQTDGRAAPPKPSAAAADGATSAVMAGGNPKVLYEQAYGFLLSQDYPAAEAAFSDFLQKFPTDGLAGNAQYWLGETFFFRGQFKAAAAAYYKGYQTYSRSVKAPDSLLKLAMSLDKLGQKDAACQSFAELATKFPTAGPQIKSRAQTETQRIGCP